MHTSRLQAIIAWRKLRGGSKKNAFTCEWDHMASKDSHTVPEQFSCCIIYRVNYFLGGMCSLMRQWNKGKINFLTHFLFSEHIYVLPLATLLDKAARRQRGGGGGDKMFRNQSREPSRLCFAWIPYRSASGPLQALPYFYIWGLLHLANAHSCTSTNKTFCSH